MRVGNHAILCVAALLLAGQAASAAITTYNRATFQAAVPGGGVTEQNFDSLAQGILGTLGNVTYGASGGSALVTDVFLTTTAPNGLGSTSVGFFESSEQALFTFASPITAFAIDVNTFATTEGAYQATLNTGEMVLSRFDVFPGTSTGQFLGLTSDSAFTSVTVSAWTGFSYTLDTLVYGEAEAVAGIPEPSTWTLVLSCGAAMCLRLRRKRRT